VVHQPGNKYDRCLSVCPVFPYRSDFSKSCTCFGNLQRTKVANPTSDRTCVVPTSRVTAARVLAGLQNYRHGTHALASCSHISVNQWGTKLNRETDIWIWKCSETCNMYALFMYTLFNYLIILGLKISRAISRVSWLEITDVSGNISVRKRRRLLINWYGWQPEKILLIWGTVEALYHTHILGLFNCALWSSDYTESGDRISESWTGRDLEGSGYR
jgi:hypothetical protein